MSEYKNNPEEFENMEVLKFAEELEKAVSRYDEDYRDGLSDCFAIKKSFVDTGVDIENKVELSVVKIREIDETGEITTRAEYMVGAEVMHFNLGVDSFPTDLWEQLRDEGLVVVDQGPDYEYDEDWIDELNDEETEFAVGYRYSHAIDTDGLLSPQSCLVVYVNGKEILLPEYREMLPAQMPDDPDLEIVHKDLESIFSSDELREMQHISAAVLGEYRPTKIIDDLYTRINDIRDRTTLMRIDAMRSVLANLLPEMQLETRANE